MAKQSCTFCRVIAREVAASIVLEDDVAVAFLDHRPLFPGHCLLVPRAHHATLADLPIDLVGPLFARAQLVARAVEEAMVAEGTFVAMNNRVSQSVPHLHVHVVPRRKKDGLRGFFWPRHKYASDEEMSEVAQAITRCVSRDSSAARGPSAREPSS